MDYAEADKLVQQLSAGFDVLQTEYQKLFGQHQALERKLATARDQVSLPTHTSPRIYPDEQH